MCVCECVCVHMRVRERGEWLSTVSLVEKFYPRFFL